MEFVMSTITYKLQEQETQAFWQAIASKTKSLVNLSFAVYTEGNSVLKWINLNNKQPLHPAQAFSLLKKENAWYKNEKDGKSVLWRFSREQEYNIVIVDDIQEVRQFKQKDHFLLWETSKGKYQAAFLLDKYLDDEGIRKIQKALIDVYSGDKACKGASHDVKMPGFFNTKYLQNPPYIKLLHVGKGILSVEQALQYYKKNIEPKEQKTKDLKSLPKLLTYRELGNRKKDWQHFYSLKGNKSDADFAYALYLMHFNLSDEEIKQTLRVESDDIENRKKGHLQDYLDRTVTKARSHFKPFEQEN
jgi:hypothetical protein